MITLKVLDTDGKVISEGDFKNKKQAQDYVFLVKNNMIKYKDKITNIKFKMYIGKYHEFTSATRSGSRRVGANAKTLSAINESSALRKNG